jgi:hypothetical protein
MVGSQDVRRPPHPSFRDLKRAERRQATDLRTPDGV